MAIAFVIDVEAASANSNDVTTAAVDTTGATLLVVAVSYDGTANHAPTDSKFNTWTPLTAYSNGVNIWIYYCENPSVGSSHTFSITATGNYPAIAMAAFSGTLASSAIDQQNGAAATQPGSITPSEDGEVLVTAHAHGGSTPAPTASAPFTTTASIAGGANNYAIGLAYEIQTTATARNPTWTTASTTPVSAIASFKAAAAASGGGMIVGPGPIVGGGMLVGGGPIVHAA